MTTTDARGEAGDWWKLRLYIAGATPKSARALVNRKRYERTLLPESDSVIETAREFTGPGGCDGGWCQASCQA